MRSDNNQLDLLRSSDAELAKAYRIAAETAKIDPFWTPDEAMKRAAYYNELADQYDSSR